MTFKQSGKLLTDSPIFIVGPGRSGTTLMQKLLSAHSKISILPETQFIEWADERENINGEPIDFESFWKQYTSWMRFKYLGIDSDRCLELIEQHGNRTIQSVFRSVLIAYGEISGKKYRMGEKSPSHIKYLPVLFDWFPNARIIVMQRDPRAVIASRLGTPWVQERIQPASLKGGIFTNSRWFELISGAKAWGNIFENIVPEWQADSRVLIMPYEKLVKNPEKEVKSICQFIGEAYEDNMLTNRGNANIPEPSETSMDKRELKWKEHHSNTTRPISSDSLGKWKKKLTSTEIAMVEQICINGIKKCGYSPTVSKANRLRGNVLTATLLAAKNSEEKVRKALRIARDRYM